MDQIGTAKLPVLLAFKEGMRLNWYMTKNTAVGLYRLILDGVKGQGSLTAITGPVGMVGIVGDAYEFGFIYLLSFAALDRKSTRLNSSHSSISYAVFCLK